MAVKLINNKAGSNGLVPTFVVLEAYFRMTEYDVPTPTMTQHAVDIKNGMKRLLRIRVKRQVEVALNQRIRPGLIVSVAYDLPLNLGLYVWREGNAGNGKRWTGLHKLLPIDKGTFKV